MGAADAVVAMGFIVVVGFICWVIIRGLTQASRERLDAAEARAERAERALCEVHNYVRDHYVEPEVKVIGDIIASYGSGAGAPDR